ncbi:MAG: hypothetical protein GY711_13830 [bacterium]|nr:hypothetical protein [bacterium]
MIGQVAKHLRILRSFARIGWIRKSQFRWEFFNQVIMDLLYYASHIFVFEILYAFEGGGGLPGWDLAAIRVFLGLVFVHDGFGMVWLGQGWHFGEDLKKGNLDPLRLRPAQPVLLYFFQRFSPEGLTNLLLGLGYLSWAIFSAGIELTPLLALLVAWALALAFFWETVLYVLWSCAEFWFTNSDLGRFANISIGVAGDRPVDIYHRYVRRLLLFVLPTGAATWVPATLILGRLGPTAALGYTVFSLAFGFGVFRFWRFGFRRYESAMG